VHLLGYDIYNKTKCRVSERLQFLKRTCVNTTLIRFLRYAICYGIGGISNREIRNSFLTYYEGPNWRKSWDAQQ